MPLTMPVQGLQMLHVLKKGKDLSLWVIRSYNKYSLKPTLGLLLPLPLSTDTLLERAREGSLPLSGEELGS